MVKFLNIAPKRETSAKSRKRNREGDTEPTAVNPTCMRDNSNDMVWRNKVPLRVEKAENYFGAQEARRTPQNHPEYENFN